MELLDFAIRLSDELRKRGNAVQHPDIDLVHGIARIRRSDQSASYWIAHLAPPEILVQSSRPDMWYVDDTATQVSHYPQDPPPDWAQWIVVIQCHGTVAAS